MIEWKRVPEHALKKAIDDNCPYSMDELKSRKRQEKIVQWRAAVAICYKLNGLTYEKAGEIVGLNHASVIHHIRAVKNELFTCDYRILDKIRLVQYYALKNVNTTCFQTQFKIVA